MTASDRLTRTSIPTIVAVALAKRTINEPIVVGRHRAQWLFDLATSETALPSERKLGRQALQAAADAAGRSILTLADGTTIGDRVYSKASNRRLRQWSQDRNSRV
jgi:hypothetical protein